MSQPLGRFAGNWVEVQECIEIMSTTDPNRRHPLSRDLIDLTNALAGWMLHLSGHAASPEAGAKVSDDILLSGHAFNAFHAIVQAQGGDTAVLSQTAGIHQPTATRTLTAAHSGYLSQMDCTQIGWAVQRLGAGRARPGDPVSAHAGIEMHAKLGDRLQANQPLVTLFAEDPTLLDEPYQMLQETLHLSPIQPTPVPLIREIIAKDQRP
jgi:pyrimidine-nucleoside phosphorylase